MLVIFSKNRCYFKLAKKLDQQGMGRHTAEEVEWIGKECIDTLVSVLGFGDFFLLKN